MTNRRGFKHLSTSQRLSFSQEPKGVAKTAQLEELRAAHQIHRPKAHLGIRGGCNQQGAGWKQGCSVQVVSVFESKDSGCDEGLFLQTGEVGILDAYYLHIGS